MPCIALDQSDSACAQARHEVVCARAWLCMSAHAVVCMHVQVRVCMREHKYVHVGSQAGNFVESPYGRVCQGMSSAARPQVNLKF